MVNESYICQFCFLHVSSMLGSNLVAIWLNFIYVFLSHLEMAKRNQKQCIRIIIHSAVTIISAKCSCACDFFKVVSGHSRGTIDSTEGWSSTLWRLIASATSCTSCWDTGSPRDPVRKGGWGGAISSPGFRFSRNLSAFFLSGVIHSSFLKSRLMWLRVLSPCWLCTPHFTLNSN